MNSIEKYVKGILEESQLPKFQREDLKLQFIDHIFLLKEEYMSKGYSEIESTDLAIKDFGTKEKLVAAVEKKPNFNKTVKGILLLLLFSCLFILFAHYIKLDSYQPGTKRFLTINSLIPFMLIKSIIRNISNYGLDRNNVDRIITYLVLFIPIGMLIPIATGKINSYKSNFKTYLILIFAILLIRFLFNIGTVYIDHAILHLTGCSIGFGIFKLLIKSKYFNKYLLNLN